MFESCPPNSAVIFGESSILNVHKMLQPAVTVVHPDGDMHDSGLGASIPTSSKARTPDSSWEEPVLKLQASHTTPQEPDLDPSSSEIADSEVLVPSSAGSRVYQALPRNSDAHRGQDPAGQPDVTPGQLTASTSPRTEGPRGSLSMLWHKFTVPARGHPGGKSRLGQSVRGATTTRPPA
jgi:hypothetical protein